MSTQLLFFLVLVLGMSAGAMVAVLGGQVVYRLALRRQAKRAISDMAISEAPASHGACSQHDWEQAKALGKAEGSHSVRVCLRCRLVAGTDRMLAPVRAVEALREERRLREALLAAREADMEALAQLYAPSIAAGRVTLDMLRVAHTMGATMAERMAAQPPSGPGDGGTH